MKSRCNKLFMVLLLLLCVSGCDSYTDSEALSTEYPLPIATPTPTEPDIPISTWTQAKYRSISPDKAAEMLAGDEGKSILLLDVRLTGDFMPSHIAGARSLPSVTISDAPPESLADMRATIIVYSATAIQSEKAALKLIQLGYENVYDMGSITDWEGELVAG